MSGHLLPPRAGHAAVNFGANGTKLYIFGGYMIQILYNDVYVLDIYKISMLVYFL